MRPCPVYVSVTYTIKCAACEKTHEDAFAQYRGSEMRLPSVPFGWNVVNGMAICPDHQLKLTAFTSSGESVDLPV